MKKKIKKFFRRLLARWQRAYKKAINYVTGKKEIIALEDTFEESFTLLYQDTYIPDPVRIHPEKQIYPGEIVQENSERKSEQNKHK